MIRRLLALTACALLACAGLAFAQAKAPKDIPTPPLHAMPVVEPQRVTLPNGITLLVVEDHELPFVDLTLMVKTGERLAPADKAGIASVFGDVWRSGGTTKHTGDELDDVLEARAASVETWMSASDAGVSMNCLTADFADVLALFTEVTRSPAFAEDKIAIAKEQARTGIARRNDQPMAIAQREAAKIAFGSDRPYARVPEYATVASITRADLLAWHTAYVVPNRMIVGVVGDFRAAEMIETLTRTFGAWERAGDMPDPPVAMRTTPPTGVYAVDKTDVNQSTILILGLGVRRDSPDFYALTVMNEILGGGFASRLFSNVRSKKGLAYAVGGAVGVDYDHPGITSFFVATKSPPTAAADEAVYEEIANKAPLPPTADEMQRARENILNSYIFRFDSRAKVLRQQMTLAYYGYPADLLTGYRAGIDKVTAADVARVAGQYLQRDKMALLVVGNAKDFDRPLSSFGSVTPIDITIPEPTAAAPTTPADPQAAAKGKALFAKVVTALGGAERVKAVRAVRYSGNADLNTPMGQFSGVMSHVIVLPDRMRMEVQLPMGTMTMVYTPGDAFMSFGPQSQDLPGSQRAEMANEMKRMAIVLAQSSGSPTFTATLAGTEKIGSASASVLDVVNDGAAIRLFVDPKTSRPVRASFRALGDSGPVVRVIDYSDYRQVSGLWLPFGESVTEDGKPSVTLTVTSYEINPAVDDAVFQKK